MCVCLYVSQCVCASQQNLLSLLSLYNSHTHICVHTHLHTHTHKQTHTNLTLGSSVTHSHAPLHSQKAAKSKETVPFHNYVSSGASSLSAKMEPSYGSIPAGIAPTQVCLRPGLCKRRERLVGSAMAARLVVHARFLPLPAALKH